MYTILFDGKSVYSPLSTGSNKIVFDPVLTQEVNKAGSLEFTIPPGHPMYDSYVKLHTLVTVEKDGEEIFRGRVLSDKKKFNLTKDIVCEGELAFLHDEVMRAKWFAGNQSVRDRFDIIITYYQVYKDPTSQVIWPGNITAVDENQMLNVAPEEAASVYSSLMDGLVNPMGGVVYFRTGADCRRYLDWLKESPHISNQVIRFGENLLDIEDYIDASDLYTQLIPYGKKDQNGNRIDISSVNHGRDWITQHDSYNIYGSIQKAVVFEDIDNPSALMSAAQSYLATQAILENSITINAIDLSSVDVDVTTIKCGDKVHVQSIPHGIDTYVNCTKIVDHLDQPSQSQYTFGATLTSLTDQQVAVKKQSSVASNAVESFQSESNANFVTRAEYNTKVADLQSQINTLAPGGLDSYLKKTDAAELYATKAMLQALEARVEVLENK